MEPILKASTTLAVLLGASEFPKSGGLSAPESFQRSVKRFESYLTDSLKLTPDNICNLFDTDLGPDDLGERIGDWVSARKDRGATDLFFYYVGHGTEDADHQSFYMAVRRTRTGFERSSSLSTWLLRKTLYEAGAGLRFYFILDCCYAAAAYKDFQDAPRKGATVLYASASRKVEAKAPGNELYTRFSSALFAALSQGVDGAEEYISFSQLGSRVEQIYQQQHSTEELVRPQLSAPNALERDVLLVPIFPNPGYREAPKQYEYFTRWVRRHGVPEGIGPLKEDDAKRRQCVIRMIRENGRIRRVETVNSKGTLVPGYYNSALLGGTPDSQDTQEQECSWEFSYYESGRVAVEEVRSASARLLYRCAYSAAQEADCTAHYFLNPSDVFRPRAKSGAAFVKIFRDERGLDRRIEFFDGSDQPQPDDFGSYGREIVANGDGLEVRVVQLDRTGRAFVCNKGYAIAKFENEALGNTISQSYFDAAETPVLHKEGYHKAEMKWSPDGNWAEAVLTGTDSSPVLSKGGFTSWKAWYDEHGNRTRQEFFGLEGETVEIADGYARWEAEYDLQGRVKSIWFVDVDGNPAYSRDGVSKVAYQYDNSGNVTEFQNLDGKSEPALDRYNVSRRARTLDAEGNVTKEKYLDADGSNIRDTDGIAGYQAEYDSEGNLLLITFLDPDGQKGRNNSGIGKIRRTYDDRHRVTEEVFLDTDDSAVENADGHHRVVRSYSEEPTQSATCYFDRKGARAFLDGYWRAQRQYDDLGNLISQEFQGDTEELCWHIKGYAREERHYDAFSRQIRQRYFGLDGKLAMTAWGYAGWDAEYEPENCRRFTYLNTDGHPIPSRPIEFTRYEKNGNYALHFLNLASDHVLNEDGISERRVELDARGNVKKTTYFGPDGKPTRRREGFAGWRAIYDRFDNRLEECYLAEDDSLTPKSDGTARLTWTYDSRQMKICETHWGVAEKRLKLAEEGYAGWEAVYDERCNQTEIRFFGAEGNDPVDCKEGYARVEAVYMDKPRIIERKWFRANGESVSNLVVRYVDGGGRIETLPDEQGGTLIQTFDRSGRAIRKEYLSSEGTPAVHLERALAFSRFEEEFDRYGRSTEQRYYGTDGVMFRSVRRVYDPAGRETEKVENEIQNGGQRARCTKITASGSEVEVFMLDAEGKPAADEFGRHKWVEHLDAQGNRTKVEYFDAAGEPLAVRGHYWSTAKYDGVGCLSEAVFSIPFSEDEIRNKKFRFGQPGGLRHVKFESIGSQGIRVGNDAYLIEYAMKEGDQLSYLTRVESSVDDSSDSQWIELTMRQTCKHLMPDGSYLLAVEVFPGAAHSQAVAQSVIEMGMTRTGKVLHSSVAMDFATVPFPAHPLFVGESWKKQTFIKSKNPFTDQEVTIDLDYSYRFSGTGLTKDGLTLGRIDVACPKTKVSLGLGGGWTISAAGVTFFELEQGFLLRSEVKTLMVTSVGQEQMVNHIHVTVQHYTEQQQGIAQAN